MARRLILCVLLTLAYATTAWALELKWEFVTPADSPYEYVNAGFLRYSRINEDFTSSRPIALYSKGGKEWGLASIDGAPLTEAEYVAAGSTSLGQNIVELPMILYKYTSDNMNLGRTQMPIRYPVIVSPAGDILFERETTNENLRDGALLTFSTTDKDNLLVKRTSPGGEVVTGAPIRDQSWWSVRDNRGDSSQGLDKVKGVYSIMRWNGDMVQDLQIQKATASSGGALVGVPADTYKTQIAGALILGFTVTAKDRQILRGEIGDRKVQLLANFQGTPLSAVYDRIYPDNHGYHIVKQGKGYGFIDSDGNKVVAPKYRGVMLQRSKSFFSVKANDGNWYAVGPGDKVLAGPFEYLSSSLNGWIPFKVNGKYGYLDQSLRVVVEPTLEGARRGTENVLPVKEDGQWFLMDYTFQTVSEQFSDIGNFSDKGVAPFRQGSDQWGFIDENGAILIEPSYDRVQFQSGKPDPITGENGEPAGWAINKSKSMRVSEFGKLVPKLESYKDRKTGKFGLTHATNKAGKWQLVDENKPHTQALFDHIEGDNSWKKLENGPVIQHYYQNEAFYAVEYEGKKRIIRCWYE